MVLNLRNFIQAAIVWIIIIPELLFAIHRENGEKKYSKAASLTEQFGRYLSMLLMILPLGIREFGFKAPEEMIIYFAANGVLLAVYLVLFFFFFKKQSLTLGLVLAAIRIFVFALCGIIFRHWFLVIFAAIFAIGHVCVTVNKYRKAQNG